MQVQIVFLQVKKRWQMCGWQRQIETIKLSDIFRIILFPLFHFLETANLMVQIKYSPIFGHTAEDHGYYDIKLIQVSFFILRMHLKERDMLAM